MVIYKVNSVEVPNQEADKKYYCGDQADIVAALADIGAGSGVIELKSPTISVTVAIEIDGGGSVVFNGNNCVFDISSGDITCFDITSATNVVFNNVGFDGGANDNGTAIESVDVLMVRNCTFNNIKTGIVISSDDANILTVLNNRFTEVGSYGIFIGSNINHHYSRIIGNSFINSAVGTSKFLHGDYFRYGVIRGNYIYKAQTGIYFEAECYFSNIEGNIFESCGGAIDLRDPSSFSCVVSGNVINNCNTGIYISQSSAHVMIGNTIEGSSGIGIWVDNAASSRNTIVCNYIRNCGTAITDTGSNTLTNNNNIA